jgi:hypothetical protein
MATIHAVKWKGTMSPSFHERTILSVNVMDRNGRSSRGEGRNDMFSKLNGGYFEYQK